MNAQEAEAEYRTLKTGFDSGRILLDEFNWKVSEFKYQDNTGIWWAINPADGSWLRWNRTVWESPSETKTAPQDKTQQPAPSSNIPVLDQVEPQKTASGSPATEAATVPAVRQSMPTGKLYAVGSIACGLIALMVFPYILGIAGIVFGAAALMKKDRLGAAGIVGSAAVILFAFFARIRP
jgi:hypothetical protein